MIDMIWTDKKRHLGLPISFTRYSLSEDRLFRACGLFNLQEEEILLYRIRDISLKRSLWQRIFGVGTIDVLSSDQTTPHLEILNVKDPREVKELIYQNVEAAKSKRRMMSAEIMDSSDAEGMDDLDDMME